MISVCCIMIMPEEHICIIGVSRTQRLLLVIWDSKFTFTFLHLENPIHQCTIHQKVIFMQHKLIHEVCRIFKLTTVHCDYYHANENKCFLNQIYNAHYISVQKAISQRKKQTDGIQFHFLPLDFHWAET